MTDTDIAALLERLRQSISQMGCIDDDWFSRVDEERREAAAALEACQAENTWLNRRVTTISADRDRLLARAEKAEEERDKVGELIDADLLARAVKAEAEVEHQRKEQQYWYDRYVELGGRKA